MDVLACPVCRQQFVLRSAGTRGGWRCSTCSNELNILSRRSRRISSLGTPLRSNHHLRKLSDGAVKRANRNGAGSHV